MKRIIAADDGSNSFEDYMNDTLEELDDTFDYIVKGIERLADSEDNSKHIQELLSELDQAFNSLVEKIAEYTLE